MVAPLPIDDHLPAIAAALWRDRAVVVVAAPGAGKTTRVPPALMADGPVILLQPRRVAARAVAARIASERGWVLGREVGWHIRHEARFGPETKLLVATEGMLTARLQQDPLLSGFQTIVLDEFHERSIHADLALALSRQAWLARDDLHIVVMSATLEAGPISRFLGGCDVIQVPGRLHPVSVSWHPGQSVADAAVQSLAESPGDVLCFLPGAGEIARAMGEIVPRASAQGVEVVPLHGGLASADQDRALQPGTRRRIIVATNIAETSLTVPGVRAVVDSGWHKVARYDVDRGVDSLETERITADSAEQRAGRAGRLGPGVVRRLWAAHDRLRPHREADIHRIDLAGPVLDVIAWGGDPRTLEWFEAPGEEAIGSAFALLERLGAVRGGRLTPVGEAMRRLPLHPRLARLVVEAGGHPTAARACALVAERHFMAPRRATTSSDLLSAVDDWPNVAPHVQRVAKEIEAIAQRAGTTAPARLSESVFRQAVLAAYPDRVAARRSADSARLKLSSGSGAVLSDDSGVREAAFLVAIDIRTPVSRGPSARPAVGDAGEPRVHLASAVDREWLVPTTSEVIHRWDAEAGRVKASRVDRYDELVLAEHPVEADPDVAARLLAAAWMERGPDERASRLLARLRFAGHEVDVSALVASAAYGRRGLADVSLADAVPAEWMRTLDRDAPDALPVPSGRSVTLEYLPDGDVRASVKLQELFGLAETPRVGPRRTAVLLALLSPAGRPVQLTRDLRSFWDRTYPEVRKELRGRYPRHPWPDDPWTAVPTARARRREPGARR